MSAFVVFGLLFFDMGVSLSFIAECIIKVKTRGRLVHWMAACLILHHYTLSQELFAELSPQGSEDRFECVIYK